MTTAAKNKDATAAFLRYLLSDDAQVAMGHAGQLSAVSALAPQMTEIAPYYKEFLEQLKTAKPRIPTPQYAKINDIFTTAMQSAIQGSVTVQAAMDDAVSQIDPLLAAA